MGRIQAISSKQRNGRKLTACVTRIKKGTGQPSGHPIPCRNSSTFRLEDELEPNLSASRVVVLGRWDCPESICCRGSNRGQEVWFIEGIEKLKPQLYLHAFSQSYVFLERQVDILDVVPTDVGKPIRHRPQMIDWRRGGSRRGLGSSSLSRGSTRGGHACWQKTRPIIKRLERRSVEPGVGVSLV